MASLNMLESLKIFHKKNVIKDSLIVHYLDLLVNRFRNDQISNVFDP
jgi:hypothetical protein